MGNGAEGRLPFFLTLFTGVGLPANGTLPPGLLASVVFDRSPAVGLVPPTRGRPKSILKIGR